MLRPTGFSIARLVLRNIPISNLVHLPRRTFPNLERLILVLTDKLDYWQFDWISHGSVKAFLDSPSLRYVALGRYFRSQMNDFIPLPLNQRTHLIDVGPFHETEEHPYPVLRRCLSIATNLRLHHFSFADDAQRPTPTGLGQITSTSLESLCIDTCYKSGDELFRTFNSPNLRSLRYRGYVSDLYHFLNGGRCGKLEHLPLLNEDGIPPSFVELLSENAPQLSSLEVSYGNLDTIFNILDSVGPSILSNLHTLSIRCAGSHKDDPSTEIPILASIRRFIANPAKNNSPQIFRTAKVFDGVDDPGTADRLHAFLLQRCNAEGVALDVGLERVENPNGFLDPLFLDLELAGWDGLRELCVQGRAGWLLFTDQD